MNRLITNINEQVTFYVLLWRRKGISLEMFDDYWRDVHGPVCARLPGQEQYFQFHLGPAQETFWPEIEGINVKVFPDNQFEGIAELTFASDVARQTWFNAAAILMDDEQNLFSKAIGYNTSRGNSITYLDRIENKTPNGALGLTKLHVLVKKADGVSVDSFRQQMKEQFAANVVQHQSVLKFRLHLFDAVDNSRPDAAGVVHFEPPENQYQAAFEIAFSDALTMREFLLSNEYQLAVSNFSQFVKEMAIFPERTAYTFVYDGQMTLAGQRSSSVAELITNIGAINQVQDNIKQLMTPEVSNSNDENNSESVPELAVN
ncbi:EthD domain-containing protein [Crocosphaera sp.]|uniref:EthD domain-containing protein n=1 Tax=Crocosphaera sp. TaxID=2729996 RepID=UPI003F21D387|nr:EthD domain-containing protein [Crocosphaera sp.]